MPELPEVETMKNALSPLVIGETINKVTLNNEKIVSFPEAIEFLTKLDGRTIESITRKGKFIIIYLDDDLALAAHMRMTGRIFACPVDYPIEKHTHLILELSNGISIRFIDPRRFGRFWLADRENILEISGISKLGLEPNSNDLTHEYIKNYLKNRKKAIKSCLLDQNFIAGIGNIYSDEILFNCKIHPARPANQITDAEIDKLLLEIPRLIEENIELCAVTADQFFKDKTNTYRNGENIRIYNHAGEPCPECGTPIEKSRIGQRTSSFCPNCQK